MEKRQQESCFDFIIVFLTRVLHDISQDYTMKR